MTHSPIIRTNSLSYNYSSQEKALSEINMCVERGSIYGFLGPNGSGKTTTLSLLLGLLNSPKGSVELFGQYLHSKRVDVLKRVGNLIEAPSLYSHLNARENLNVYRAIYGASKARIDEVLRIVGLNDTGNKMVKKFSLGMKQRLSIALALLPNPELLILDEPANGLDPAGIIELRELIKRLNRDYGMTILVSSHLLAEVEKMVTHVGIIRKGKMLFQGPLSDLHSFQQKASRLLINTSNNKMAFELLSELQPAMEEETISVAFDSAEQVAKIARVLTQAGLDLYLLSPRKNDLEQLFIDLTSSQS